jgi:rod shape determining protein RodA
MIPEAPELHFVPGAMLFLAGLRWSWIAAAVLAIVLVGVLAIPHIKAGTGYKLQRIKAVYWPDIAEKQYRYQNEQAEIAVGSGGLFGKGFHSGTQGSLGFVPEVHTDFIFAVTCEETGFVGATFALTIYLLVISKLVRLRARLAIGPACFCRWFCGTFALPRYGKRWNGPAASADYGHSAALMSYGGSSLMATFLDLVWRSMCACGA